MNMRVNDESLATMKFGVGQPASFESLSPTLSPPFWGMHGGAHARIAEIDLLHRAGLRIGELHEA